MRCNSANDQLGQFDKMRSGEDFEVKLIEPVGKYLHLYDVSTRLHCDKYALFFSINLLMVWSINCEKIVKICIRSR